jgi:hypothetical protein
MTTTLRLNGIYQAHLAQIMALIIQLNFGKMTVKPLRKLAKVCNTTEVTVSVLKETDSGEHSPAPETSILELINLDSLVESGRSILGIVSNLLSK